MKEPQSPRPDVEAWEVSDAAQARILTDPVAKEFFTPFLATERRAAETARQLECSTQAMLYRIRTMLDCGLLQIVRIEPRAGRAVKVYRSVHDAYFVPFAATDHSTWQERLREQGEPIWAGLINAYADALRRSRTYGHVIYRIDEHLVHTTHALPTTTPSGQAVFWSDTTVMITDTRARELAAELGQWYDWVQQSAAESRDLNPHRYLCMAALLPTARMQS